MDKYLNKLRNEQKKRVRFHIVEDNARFHSSIAIDEWKSTDRRPLRRHHSQPIMRKRYGKEAKATVRWNTESSKSAAPLKCPKRQLLSGDGDRWRVSRNHSDSIIHSPPKRRFTSPSSPMLMMASRRNLVSKSVDKCLPYNPPLQTNEVFLDQALRELKTDDNFTKNSERDRRNLGKNEEIAPLVQRRKPISPQQSQQQQDESHSTNLKYFFSSLNLMFLWSWWNAIYQYICCSIFRRNGNEKNPIILSKDEQSIERMEQGETIPLAMSPLPQSNPTPSSSWEPYSLPVLYHK